jgi:hypothetical protein
MRGLVRRPSPSMVVALVALFVALGGTGYAASKIGSAQIKNNSIKSVDVKNRSLGTADLSSSAKRSLKGQIGPIGPVGPAGPSGTTAFHPVDGSSVFMCADGGGGCQVQAAQASCPAGEVATGGGWQSDSIDIVVGYARRTDAGTFSVIGINYATTSRSLTAQVICARGPGIGSAKRLTKTSASSSPHAALAAAREQVTR